MISADLTFSGTRPLFPSPSSSGGSLSPRNYFTHTLGLEDAQDLAQETLVAAYIHLDGVEEGKLRAWLMTVARRKYIDWLRRNRKGVTLVYPVPLDDDEVADRSGDPEAMMLGKEHRELVLAALAALSLRERNLLILRHNLGLSQEEIGKILGMKPNTVKVSLYRARQRFRVEYLGLKGDGS